MVLQGCGPEEWKLTLIPDFESNHLNDDLACALQIMSLQETVSWRLNIIKARTELKVAAWVAMSCREHWHVPVGLSVATTFLGHSSLSTRSVS